MGTFVLEKSFLVEIVRGEFFPGEFVLGKFVLGRWCLGGLALGGLKEIRSEKIDGQLG